MDVAHLGFRIDASEADKGTASLNKLTGAAERAETAERGLASASKATSAASAAVVGSSNSAAAALTREATAATKAAGAVRMATTAANQNVRHLSGSFSGLGAQVQDIGVTAAMGMNPMIIGLQQGTQIAGQMEMAMRNGASASVVFKQAITSLITPISLMAIGLTVLLAAGLQMIDWSSAAAGALNLLASAIDAIGPYAVMAAGALALLYAPAILGGLTVLSELILGITARLIGLAAGFALANPALAFVLGITAAVAAAGIFRDELTRIFGVDIVGAAKAGVNYIIGSFVAAYQDIKFVWAQLPNIIGAAAVGAANATLSAIEAMINGASALLNSFIDKANSALSMLPGGLSIGKIGEVDFGSVANPYADALAKAVGSRNAAVQDALSRDYIGSISAGISDMTSGAAEKLRGLAGSIGGVEDAAKKAGSAGKAAGEKIKDGAKAAADKMSEAASVAKGFLSTLRQGLMSGKSLWESFGDAALGVLDKIMDKAETALANALFPSSGGGLFGGGGGGLFGGILGGIASLFGFASGGVFGPGGVHAFARGGVVTKPTIFPFANGTGLMGESGPEAIMPLRRGADGRLGVSAANSNRPQRIDVFVHSNDEKLRVFVRQEADGQIREATPQIVGAAVGHAKAQVVPTMAEYQRNRAGGDYRG